MLRTCRETGTPFALCISKVRLLEINIYTLGFLPGKAVTCETEISDHLIFGKYDLAGKKEYIYFVPSTYFFHFMKAKGNSDKELMKKKKYTFFGEVNILWSLICL